MPKPSFDGSQPDFRTNGGNDKSRRIARDLSNLQYEIRVDFDQRISDLTSLMNKFRTLMISDIRSLNAANDSKKSGFDDNIPILTNKIDDEALADSEVISQKSDDDETVDNQTADEKPALNPLYAIRETARFEAGLYQLNCQLYRFRLELDQELEYRQEPLHIHFNQQSELANVLRKITDDKQVENKVDR